MNEGSLGQPPASWLLARWLFAIGIIIAAVWIWHANGLPGLAVKDGTYACSGTDYQGSVHEYIGEIRDGEWNAWVETTSHESNLPDIAGLARETPHRTSLFDDNATKASTVNAGAVECHWIRAS